MTYQVTQAQEKVYTEYKDAIIACFKAVGLSLAINGLEDYLLKVQDCLNLTIRDQQIAPEGTIENLAIINNDSEFTIEVDNNKRGLLYIAQEVANSIQIKEEDKNDIITNSGVKLDKRFNLNKEGEFD